jgi:REP element-mobilizing transposase RayT
MRISVNSPCYYFTSVAHHRLPILRTDKLKQIAAEAFNEARRSAGLLIFAYVLMPDHYHMITDSTREPSETARYLNGISAKRILDYLKEHALDSLDKLRTFEKKRGYKHSVWEHHPDKFLITSDSMFIQKRNYIHDNPVRAGLADNPDDYLYSSSRIWNRRPLENEPLRVDIDQIEWRLQ